MADLAHLINILDTESAEVDAMVATLDEATWDRETPAAGWTIRRQISHLAWTDEWAVLSVDDPKAFFARALAIPDPDEEVEIGARRGDTEPSAELLARWRAGRVAVASRLAKLPPDRKLPWFGLDNTVELQVIGRIMETFAHGTDIADTLGIQWEHGACLRPVADLGVATRAWSYATRGMPARPDPVRVELRSPEGAMWTYGPVDARNRVTGPALDFCLNVTQRRHRGDLKLRCVGPAADEWMSIAQAYSGSPGAGRRPGQFAAV